MIDSSSVKKLQLKTLDPTPEEEEEEEERQNGYRTER